MTERLSLADETVRGRALDPQHSFVVQAPAGSGKTELLTQRYLRLLAEVERPEQILAITFTRKAANEMRNRIVQSLTRARSEARPAKAYEAHTWDLASAALAADAARDWRLEAHPARLRIQTIDALNAGLSRRLPVLSGTGAAMDIAQDTRPIYEAVCQRLLESLGDGSQTSAQLQTVLLHLANRVSILTDMVCELLAKRDQWLPLLINRRANIDLRAGLEVTLSAAIERHLHNLHAALPPGLHAELIELVAYSVGNRRRDGLKLDVYLEACGELSALPPLSVDALHAWRGIATVVCKKDGGFYAVLNKTQGFPPEDKHAKQRMLALLNALRETPGLAHLFQRLHVLPAPRFSDAQWQVLGALLHLLPDAVDKLHLEFQARGQVDYIELSLRALQALGPPDEPTDLALALDENTRHILVDEFQDTSFTQMALLNALTAGWSAGDGRTLFCVGDPMQSIYRFRQAEVGLFLELQTRGLPNVAMTALRLQTNFRSTQPIIDWVNRCFPQILPPVDDSDLGAVKYSSSVAHLDAPAVGEVRVHAGIARSAQEEAQRICQLVQAAVADANNERIAILVSNRSHAGPIAQALKQAGVEFRAVEIERLQDRPLVQDLMSLTRALLHLGDRTAWLACLRAPWCGLTLADLHAVAANEPDETIWSLLTAGAGMTALSAAGQVRAARFKAVMEGALSERGRYALRDWIERCWLTLNGPSVLQSADELDDAEAFFERLEVLSVAGDLEDIARLEEQLDNLFANSRNAQNEARVEIMTIHKSKGLEFDRVILPSLHRVGGRNNKVLLRWARLNGLNTEGLVLAPVTAQGQDPDSIYQWLSDLERRRSELERGRLLYVAATRAKRELHLFGSVKTKKNGEELGKPPAGSLLDLLWPQLEAFFQTAFAGDQAMPLASSSAREVLFKRLPLEWTPPAADAAVQGAAPPSSVNAEFERPDFDWVGEASRHVGTVTHAELERLVKLAPEKIRQWTAAARRPELLLQLAELGVPEILREAACRRVITAIERTLNDTRGRWILGLEAPHQEAVSELALSGFVDRTLVNSVIDRSFVDELGTRWIIDFKTSSHEGGGREAFLANEAARYRPQLVRYAKLMAAYKPGQPVKAALYFPLLGEWREVHV